MCEFEQKLPNIEEIRISFNHEINKLQIEYPKLHTKLIPILYNIDKWMRESESYLIPCDILIFCLINLASVS